MKPKHRRSAPQKRRPAPHTPLHTIAFSVESLTVLEASLHTMEVLFQQQISTAHPRLPFALETFARVKHKVRTMLHAPGETVALDGNEVLIIRACVQVYCLDLLCMQATPQREYLLALCYQCAGMLPNVVPPPARLQD